MSRFSKIIFLLGCSLVNGSIVSASVLNIWATEGGDKVAQEELRVSRPNGRKVISSTWDGETIRIFGAKNEVVNFNLVIESPNSGTNNVSISFDQLTGPNGSIIKSLPTSGDGVFNYVGRNIELFYVRYLQIKGLSHIAWSAYDERLLPKRLQRPWQLNERNVAVPIDGTTWQDRPDHNAYYPDIAVPLELVKTFNVLPDKNQSIWADIYIPSNAVPGVYAGKIEVAVNGAAVQTVPVSLKVYNFTLPDIPTAKTMLFHQPSDINDRFLGKRDDMLIGIEAESARKIHDRYFLQAHRHKISLVGDVRNDMISVDENGFQDAPSRYFAEKLSGSFFAANNGYDGPGVNTGNNVYSIFTYGNAGVKASTETLQTNANGWVNWFNTYAPNVEYFHYLIDEPAPSGYSQVEQWAASLKSNSEIGKTLKSFCTVPLPDAAKFMPSLDIAASSAHGFDNPDSQNNPYTPEQWANLARQYSTDPAKRFFFYNGAVPAAGSFYTDDDGVSLRATGWSHYKKKINRWFYWNATYYTNDQGLNNLPLNSGQNTPEKVNLFQSAYTYGDRVAIDTSIGEWATFNGNYRAYSNGDGVLMYPGTDVYYPADSYGLNGPIASLRLKYWRRGIQDVDYLTMAYKINPAAVTALVEQIIPDALWEVSGSPLNYATSPPSSWSNDPETWENARRQLAEIIEGQDSMKSILPSIELLLKKK